MFRGKSATLLIILLSTLFLVQCARNSLETGSNDATSLFGMGFLFATSPITIQAGGLDYEDNNTFNFGTVTTGSTSQLITLTIQNTGTENITFPAAPVAVSGDDAADFTVTDPGITDLAPGATATFTAIFTPGGEGARDGVITILNSENEVIYTLNLTGTGTATPVPDIYVESGVTYYASGSGYAFGTVTLGSSSTAINFTIRNTGTASLTLTGSPAVMTGGTNAPDFIVSGPAGTTIASGMSETFTVTFTPTAVGTRSATVRIDSNDPDIGSYIINFGGTGAPAPVPDINLSIGAASYLSGSSYSYGSLVVGTSSVATFTVQNLGTLDLNIGTITLSGADPGDFSTAAPGLTTIPAGGSTTFSVTFTPTAISGRSAILTIASDDPDEGAYTVNLSGTGTPVPAPEINIHSGGTNFFSGSIYGYGTVTVGTPSVITFTIENLGTAPLALTGAPVVDITGANAADFTVSGPAFTSIAAGDSETFTVTFTPSMVGPHAALMTIASDDADEGAYAINLSGDGVATTVPDINVQYSGTDYLSTSLFMFPGVPVGGTSGDLTFTIQNPGTGTLTISAPVLSGTNAAEFTVDNLGATVISSGGSTTFTLSFNPAGVGGRSALLTIASDDPDEGTYTINLVGDGTAPEINLQINSVDHASGSIYNFGTANVGSPIGPVTYTLQNLGTEDLNVTGYTLTGTEAADFTVSGFSTGIITAGGSSSFTITFTPGAAGARTALLTVTSDDADEGTYTITLNGTGTNGEINLQIGGADYAAGGTYDYGSAYVGTPVGPEIYTIQNLGTGDLNVTGYTVTGANQADFSVSGFTTGTYTSGGSSNFTITFTPGGTGSRTALLTVTSDDADEGTYTINLEGTGLSPEINIQYSGADIPSGNGVGLNPVNVGGSGTPATFTIQNLGNADLNISGYAMGGANPGDYSVTGLGAGTIPASGSITFDITFMPTAAGSRTASITINSDDADEGSYVITLNATGLAPEIDFLYSGTSYASGGTFSFGGVQTGGTSGAMSFTIENTGGAPLEIFSYSLTGANSTEFNVAGLGATVIPAGGTVTFTMAFNPTGQGLRTAELTIASDDADESPYTVYLEGMGTEPDINIQIIGTDYSSGSTYNFGSSNVGTPLAPVTFTIQNLGTGDLDVTGYSVTGTAFADYSVSGFATGVISAGGSVSFTVTFTPGAAGSRMALLTVNSDDADEGTYSVNLMGNGTSPEINLRISSIDYASGDTSTLGSATVSTTIGPLPCMVENLGTGDLDVTGYTLSGTNQSDFSVTGFTTGNITTGGSMGFSISFTPGGVGTRTAVLTVNSNDADEGTYTVYLEGTGTAPEINLQYNTLDFPSGNGLGMTSVNVGSSGTPETFTIQNLGNADLNITGYTLTGANPGDFMVSGLGATSITFGGSTTFDVTFSPTAAGGRSAAITITSDDADEGSYVINLTGAGLAPEIAVQQGGSDVTNYDFGTVVPPLSGVPVPFTIQNQGTGDLTITGWGVSGSNPSDFTISGLTAGVISSGGTMTFTVTFKPGASGSRDAQLTINSDDSDENPYMVDFIGTGGSIATSAINVKIGATDYPSGVSAYDFGNVQVNTPKSVTVTIENNGVGGLELSGNPVTDDVVFSVTGPAITSIPGGSSVTFTLTFIPAGATAYTGRLLTINSNDPTYPAYTIDIAGTGTAAAVQDIDVSISGMDYLTGSTFDFGAAQQALGSSVATFTITNNGTADLNIGSCIVADNPTDYTAGTPASTLLTAGSSTTLDVTFTPTVLGTSNGTLEIASDDTDETPYIINLTGRGTLTAVPDISVEVVGVTCPSGSHYNFEALFDSNATVTFEIWNLGDDPLVLYSPFISISGFHASDYTITDYPNAIVPAGNSTTFDVMFSPGAKGIRSANLVIPNNDPDEGSYVINLDGIPVIPLRFVHGGSSDTSLYDPVTNTFTSSMLGMTGTIGTGAHAFRIPEGGPNGGQYMVIHGNGTGTTLYDPTGPSVMSGYPTIDYIGAGAHSFLITGGSYQNHRVVVCGSGSSSYSTVRFNPTLFSNYFIDSWISDFNTNAGDGAFSFTNDDGNTIIVLGNNSSYYQVFNQASNTLDPATYDITDGGTYAYIGNGGHASRILGGAFPNYLLIVQGGSSQRTWIFRPTSTPAITQGPNLYGGATAYTGSFSIPITRGPNAGKILIVHGGSLSTTSIYNPDFTISEGPTLSSGIESGAFSFEITGGEYKGMYMIIHGNFGTTTSIFNPDTLSFITQTSDNLPSGYPASAGAHVFPAR